ncbi:MAG TPA: alpha/beta fold hydrolase, partial [Longimicrobiaceae bacterium]|nr:alpha/beta fold hydrolase [Longimicrobiaceae bacterium]
MPDGVLYEPEPFRPAWWLPGGHAHTIAGRFIRPLDRGPLRAERLELPDGDFVDLHEGPETLPTDSPIVLILHGLEGCYASNYVATVSRALAAEGIRAIRFNFRGCSGAMNRLARFYHAGETGDLHQVIAAIRERSPAAPLGAVGFSLGGNVLLKYLGERGAEAREGLAAAAAVSVPFDLAAGTRRLEEPGLTRVYMRYFIRKLRRKARAKREVLAPACEVDRAIGARTIRAYDDALTARLHGFRDAWHYYDESSSA